MITRRLLPTILNIGIVLLLIDVFVHIGGAILHIAGTILELIFFILLLLEIFTSRKAPRSSIIIWGIAYIAVAVFCFLFVVHFILPIVFIAGSIYLISGRKKFVG